MTKKLTPTELRSYESLLRAILVEMNGDIDHLQREALGDDPHESQGDEGVDAWAQEFSLELLQHDESTLGEILAALERIKAGSYGRCESCAIWIPRSRLKAMPYARNCIDCQRAVEGGKA